MHAIGKTGALILLTCLFVFSPVRAANPVFSAESLWNGFLDRFEFLPEYHMEAELSTFLFHKNPFFRERYFFENNMYFEFSLIGIKKLVYSTDVPEHNFV